MSGEQPTVYLDEDENLIVTCGDMEVAVDDLSLHLPSTNVNGGTVVYREDLDDLIGCLIKIRDEKIGALDLT